MRGIFYAFITYMISVEREEDKKASLLREARLFISIVLLFRHFDLYRLCYAIDASTI